MRPTEGPQKETGQLGGFNDETGAQSRVKTNRNRLLINNGQRCFSVLEMSDFDDDDEEKLPVVLESGSEMIRAGFGGARPPCTDL